MLANAYYGKARWWGEPPVQKQRSGTLGAITSHPKDFNYKVIKC